MVGIEVPMAAVSEADGGEEASSPANDIIEHAIMELSKASSSASHDNEAGQSTSEYHSCPSAMMAQGALTQYSVSSKHPKINQTMETRNTSFNSSSDEESALGGVRIRGGKKAVGGRHAMTNHKRNVIAASVVSVVLVVLVGLGLGLSNKGDDDSNNNAASNGMEGLSGSIATTPVEGSSDDGQNSLFVYLDEETNNPTVPIRPTSTPSLSSNPSNSPTATPTSFPSTHPTLHPTSSPSSPPTTSTHPTLSPTSPPSISLTPTSFPSSNPSISPTKLFLPGDLTILNEELEIYMSSGLSVKLIATTGETVKYINGQESTGRYHSMMDGAGIVPLDGDDGIEGSGGYVYVSNSEISSGDGGVYGLYFDEDGNVVDYKTLLSDTNRNCGGGITPWATWVSCEETTGGQCWQVDPDPNSVNHHTPKETLLGGDGGRYETVACDNRNPARPIFFTTEDHEYGALRRFEADTNGWDSLHTGGKTTFLRIIDDINYEWTDDESWARSSASAYYRNSEGVSYHDGKLYFAAKKTHTLFILDLQKMTYEAEYTGALFTGQGSFNAQPDQLFLGNYKRWIYFTEDGGNSPGVYVRDADGTYSTIFEAVEGGMYGGKYGESDETVGIALSPDRKKMYAGFQDGGILMEFTRDDGVPFE